MSNLDSRFLRLGDCFAQRFFKPGSVTYTLTSAAGALFPMSENTYSILVKPAKGKGGQHNIVVSQKGNTLMAEPAHIEIGVGDTVLWHTLEAATQGYAVMGEGEPGKFSSLAMSVEALYSHIFGAPGRYEWVDANGGRIRGGINVKNPAIRKPEDHKKWLQSLGKGAMIKISGNNPKPAQVEIVMGQTVFWVVEKAAGISITDSRLVHGSKMAGRATR